MKVTITRVVRDYYTVWNVSSGACTYAVAITHESLRMAHNPLRFLRHELKVAREAIRNENRSNNKDNK